MTSLNRRAQHIQSLAAEINRLSAELDSLLSVSDHSLPGPSPPPPLAFVPGARVEILNNRYNLQGSRGTIVRTNPSFVFFRLDSSNEVIWRSRRNLCLLSPS